MRTRAQRVAAARGEGKRAGLYETDEQAARQLLRRVVEAEARDRFPEPRLPREIVEQTRDRARTAAERARLPGDAAPARWIDRGGVALALTGGLLMLLAARSAGAAAAGAAGAAGVFAAWLVMCCAPVARLGDRLGRAAAAALHGARARRFDRKLAAHDAARRRRREHVDVESAVDLAALAVGLAEGRAALAAGPAADPLELPREGESVHALH